MAGGEDTCQENDVVRPPPFSGGFKDAFTSCELTHQYIICLDSCLQKHLVRSLLIWYDYILFLSSLFGAYDLMFMFAIMSNEN